MSDAQGAAIDRDDTDGGVPLDVLVRPLRESDRERWLELWDIYLTFYEEDLEAEVTEVTWQRLLAREHGMGALVATDHDGHVAGLAHHVVHAGTWSTQPVCYLEDLVVDPAMRGRGYGRALIDALRCRARELGCKTLYWHTAADNATARRLYDGVATLSGYVRYDLELEDPR
jgi:GNAT superfamily N-acetyltransferase